MWTSQVYGHHDNMARTKTHRTSLLLPGLYLYTLIIGHTSCNILSILNKLKLWKELQTFVTNNVFLDKKVKTTATKQKIKHKKTLPEQGIEPVTSCTQS